MEYYDGSMKNRLLFPLFLSFCILTSCASNRNIQPDADHTPGTTEISENLFCDQTEITNFHWLEYMYWTERAYGSESEQYKATFPQELDWSFLTCEKDCKTFNYRHPDNRNYPVVGITQEQAKAFSQWRSDRVFEYNLIRAGIINFYPEQPDTALFSIQNYFEGKYYQPIIEKKDTIGLRRVEPDFTIPYPTYSLPTNEERLIILNYIDSTDAYFHHRKERRYTQWRQNNVPFLLAHNPCFLDSLNQPIFRNVDHGLDPKNKFNLVQNSRGNGAEWGDAENVTFGGGWAHNVEYVLANDTIPVFEANVWTGFRNVCTWRKWEIDK